MFFVLHVHPVALLVLPSLPHLPLLVGQLHLHLRHCLLDLRVGLLPVESALVVLVEVLLAADEILEFEGAVGEHVDGLQLAAGVLVQLLEQLQGLGVLLDLDEVLACAGDCLRVVLLALLHDPAVHFQQFSLRAVEVVLPHQVVRDLQVHVDAAAVELQPLLHRLLALRLRLLLLQQVRHAHLRDAGVGLRDVPLDLRLGRHGLEGVRDALPRLLDASLEGLDGLHSLVDLSEFQVALVGAGRHFVDGPLQDHLRFLFLLGGLEQIGETQHQHLVVGVLGVGESVEVLRLLVLQGLVLLFRHFEEGFEGQRVERFHSHQQLLQTDIL